MNFSDIFKLATRMFKARTSRTFLTILGMSVGIGAILFLVSLGYGLQKTLLEKITTSDSLLTLDVSEGKDESVILNNDTLDKIRKIEGVKDVIPSFQLTAQGHLENISADLSATITKPPFIKLTGLKILKGEVMTDEKREGVLITSSVAQVFGKSIDDMIGKEITFTFFIPKSGALAEENIQASSDRVDSSKKYIIVGEVEGDESIVYVNLGNADDVKIERYSQAKVKCESNSIMPQVRERIGEEGLLVSALSDTVDQANQVFNVVKIILMLFGIIALIVSAIGMFNTMTIALLERTEEIGIMKSIGASDAAISLMFIMESTIMGFLGGLLGIIIGWLEGAVFNGVINFIAVRFGGEKISLFYSPPWFVLTVIIFAAFVGFLTGVIPARRASRIDPLEALRYK